MSHQFVAHGGANSGIPFPRSLCYTLFYLYLFLKTRCPLFLPHSRLFAIGQFFIVGHLDYKHTRGALVRGYQPSRLFLFLLAQSVNEDKHRI